MSKLEADDLRWALQRRIEDVFAKLGEKFGDLTGRVETDITPSVSFDDIGGLAPPEKIVAGFPHALPRPHPHPQGGLDPPTGGLPYPPPARRQPNLPRRLPA